MTMGGRKTQDVQDKDIFTLAQNTETYNPFENSSLWTTLSRYNRRMKRTT